MSVRRDNIIMGSRGPLWLRRGLAVAGAVSVACAGAAYAAGTGRPGCALAPLGSLAWYVATLYVCYRLHAPLLAPGVVVPAISEMGVSRAARLAYRVGFGCCGMLLAVTVLLVGSLTAPHSPEPVSGGGAEGSLGRTPPSRPGIEWGMAAAFGVSLQGICTLNLDVGSETFLHLGGAMLAMMGTMQHAEASNAYFSALPSRSPLLHAPGTLGSWGLWFRRDLFRQALAGGGLLAFAFAIPLLIQLATRLGRGASGHMMENGMGCMQWIIVAGIASYFCSYTFDLIG